MTGEAGKAGFSMFLLGTLFYTVLYQYSNVSPSMAVESLLDLVVQ